MSVRHVAALKTFEHAIVRRDAASPRRADAPRYSPAFPRAGAMGRRLGERAPAAQLAIGKRRRRSPADADRAAARRARRRAAAFSSADERRVERCRRLDAARWYAPSKTRAARRRSRRPTSPGAVSRCDAATSSPRSPRCARRRGDAGDARVARHRGSATLARWRAEQMSRSRRATVSGRNPWGGVAGCIYFGGEARRAPATSSPGAARRAAMRLCRRPGGASAAARAGAERLAGEPRQTAVDDARWTVPPSLARCCSRSKRCTGRPARSTAPTSPTTPSRRASGRLRRVRTASTSPARRSTSATRST